MNKNIDRFIKNSYYNVIALLPTRWNMNFRYFRKHKKFPNLDNPISFSEKILASMLDSEYEKYDIYVDKYLVREEIKKLIGEEYLNGLIGEYSSFEDIDFDKLPKSFVLKGTNGSDCNLVVKDKDKINWNDYKKEINRWVKIDYYKMTKEPQYKNVKARIICEEYLEDDSGSLRDYKIFCFGGNPEFIQVDSDRFGEHTQDFYDTNWNKLNLQFAAKNSDKVLDKPEKLDELVELARKLSKDFKFVRVDFYYVDNKIYFGELTFHPKAGSTNFKPEREDKRIAALIK